MTLIHLGEAIYIQVFELLCLLIGYHMILFCHQSPKGEDCKCNQPFEGFGDWMTENLKGLTFCLSMCVILKYLMKCSLMQESERIMKHWRKYSIKSLVKGKWSYIELSQELYKLKLKIQAWRQQKSFKSYQSLKFKIQAWTKKVCFW